MEQPEQPPHETVTLAGADPAEAAAIARPIGELQGLPLSLPPYRAGLWRSDVASLAAALALHGGLLLAIVHATSDRLVGGGGSELDAINIELVSPSEVLEALAVDPTAAVAANAVASDVARVAAPARSAATDEQKARRDGGLVAPDESAPALEDETDLDEQVEAAPTAAAAENAEASETSAAARGTGTLGLEAPVPAAAPPGVERDYAKTVLFALARNKPKASAGSRGIVRIGFTVLASGRVGTVRVAQSSGKPQLDEAALAAVRTTAFPAPPPALGAAALAYEIPYIFR